MEFGRKKPAPLFNAIHNTKNPLNWFERMRQRQNEKPEFLNANVGQIHRTIESREQAMVGKSGSGDQRALGKLAAMNPVEYYKTRSGVLNQSRSDPVLIKKIREANVPSNNTVATVDPAEFDAASAGGAGGPPAEGDAATPAPATAGGGAEGSAGGAEGSAGAEGEAGSDGEGDEGGGGGAAPMVGGGASSSSTVEVPESLVKYEDALAELKPPTSDEYADDVRTLRKPALVAKYGPVPGATILDLMAVITGLIKADADVVAKCKAFITDTLGLTFGSREFIRTIHYAETESSDLPEDVYKAKLESMKADNPELLTTKPLVASKKEMDAKLKQTAAEEAKEIAKLFETKQTELLFEAVLEPFKSGNKDVVRDGLNFFMGEVVKAAQIARERRPDKTFTWPNSIEVRKTTNNSKIGRLFIDGQDISAYTTARKEDPNLINILSKIGGFFSIIRENLKERKLKTRGPLLPTMSREESYAHMSSEYPLIQDAFDNLQGQIDSSLKIVRGKKKGGRPAGSKNAPKTGGAAMVEGALGGQASEADGEDEA